MRNLKAVLIFWILISSQAGATAVPVTTTTTGVTSRGPCTIKIIQIGNSKVVIVNRAGAEVVILGTCSSSSLEGIRQDLLGKIGTADNRPLKDALQKVNQALYDQSTVRTSEAPSAGGAVSERGWAG